MSDSNLQAFLGIDISIGARPVTFVALDADQRLLAIGEGDVPDALAYAAGQTCGAVVAVNAAARPNQGRMKRAQVRQSLNPPPAPGKSTALRQVEYELLQAGIRLPETPDTAEKSLPWVRRGYSLTEKLEDLGYDRFTTGLTDDHIDARLWLETNADACFWSLLQVQPLASGTLEGRIQRQLALRDEGLAVPDAMDFFEEITRHRLLKSILPTENIFSQAEINAWIAAHTAWLAANQPRRVQIYGEPEEGLIFVPKAAQERLR